MGKHTGRRRYDLYKHMLLPVGGTANADRYSKRRRLQQCLTGAICNSNEILMRIHVGRQLLRSAAIECEGANHQSYGFIVIETAEVCIHPVTHSQ